MGNKNSTGNLSPFWPSGQQEGQKSTLDSPRSDEKEKELHQSSNSSLAEAEDDPISFLLKQLRMIQAEAFGKIGNETVKVNSTTIDYAHHFVTFRFTLNKDGISITNCSNTGKALKSNSEQQAKQEAEALRVKLLETAEKVQKDGAKMLRYTKDDARVLLLDKVIDSLKKFHPLEQSIESQESQQESEKQNSSSRLGSNSL